MKLRRLSKCALLAFFAILLDGCATSALWQDGRFARYREPAAPPNLKVFQSPENQSPRDVLVEYDEARDATEDIHRRAYWLNQNGEPVKNPHKPRFVMIQSSEGLAAVPMVESLPPDAATNRTLYALVATNGIEFSLHSAGKVLGNYELPVYETASGKTKQVLLTPVAVVADLTIIGGFLFLWAWSSGGLNCVH